MAVNFLLKRSNTASKRPTAAQLDIGELSLNYDANTAGVFFEDSTGAVRKVGPAEVSAAAPNATPAGSAGNSLGEFWYDTAATNLKIWTGSAFVNATTNITGSAATLTTTRTIWGQNFNGSANVSGALSGATTIAASSDISLGGELNFTTASNKYIDFYTDNDAGGLSSANLRLVNNGSTSFHSAIVMQRGGAVTLYHNNASKLATSANGVDITGTLTVTSNTLVTNLNADLLDGISSGSFLRSDANNDLATGTIYTSSWIEAGRTSGSIALTANDGYGNANVAFNHKAGIPDATGSSGRITCAVDSTTASMGFQLGNSTTSGVAVGLTTILDLNTSGANVTGTLTSSSTVQGTRLISTVATGTAPLTVASTTLVTNLNADLLDGLNSASTNTVSTIVARDASGNFSAGTITAALTGNASSATNLAGGSIGTIPYQSGAGATAMLAVGTAGQALVSAGAAAPTWATLTLENLPDAAFKRSVRVATTADLGASTFAAGVLTGYDDVISLNVTTTLSSTTATTTSTAGIKAGAVISGNANIPAATTVASITNATTFVMSAAATAAGTAVATTFTQTIAALAVDGVTLALNDRVLVKNQSTLGGLADANGAAKNGIYRLSTLGSATVPWVLTRVADADTASELAGALVNVDSGTVNGGFLFDTDFRTTDTLDTTLMVWSRIVDTGLGNTTAGTIAMNGVQAAGTSDLYARADHVHPSDTSRAPLASPTFTGTPAAPTAAVDTNTTQIATTAFVVGQASATNPLALGTVAVGTSLRYARQDHVHPTTGLGLTSGTLAQFAATTSAQLAGVISDETGSGVLVFATSPTLVTPVLGVASATSVNKVAITAPVTGATLTIADGKTLTASNTLTFTGTDASSVAFGTGGTVAYTGGTLAQFAATTSAQLAGVISDETGSGALVFAASPTLSGTPLSTTAAVDTNTTQIATTAFVVAQASATNPLALGTVAIGTSLRYARQDHVHPTTGLGLTGGTLAQFAATTSAQLAGVISDETGSGALVFGTSPSLTTPALSGETFSTTNNVTAGTNAQGQGALTSDYNVITTAASNPSGVTLPTATTGRKIVIVNKGANPIAVFPATGGTIDALAINTAISVPVNGVMEFNASSTTQWYSTNNLTISGSLVTSFSAGTTGLTPSTATSGAVTLAGTLAVANGGTGVTTSTGTSSVVLSASPTLSGTPLSTTAAVDTNTTQIATTAFVVGQASATNPLALGTVAVGTSLRYARQDHVHPTTGLGLTSGTLAQFAATTSAQLAGVISDETGSGALVFATSPTLVTPILGTPTSGNLSNCTSIPAGQLTGTIPSAVLGNSSLFIGTTSIALNRASAAIALTGITSIDGDAASVDGKSFGTFTAAGGVLYATSTTAASGTAAGTSGQALLSAGASAPVWTNLTLENLPDAAFKRSVRCATTADLAASTFAAGVLTGYDDVISLNVTTTLSSTTATTTSTAGIKVGAVISGNANIPAATTVVSITNATTFVMSAAATAAGTAVATTFTQTISALVVDGITLALNDRVLVKNQSTLGGLADGSASAKQGIYFLSTLGSGTVPWVLTRAADADTSSEIGGGTVNVDSGATHGGQLWTTSFKTTDTINTTAQPWYLIIDTSSANSTAGTIAMNGTQAAGTSNLYARADHVHPVDTSRQAALGFTPVQQGGGTSQTTNKLYIGWSAGSQLRLQVDVTDFGASWPINVTGSAATLTTTRTLWGQNFNGGANVTGSLTSVGDITGSAAVTLSSAAASALNLTAGTTGAVTLDSGTTGAVNIGNNANAKTITLGNVTGATTINVNSGTGGILVTSPHLTMANQGEVRFREQTANGTNFIGLEAPASVAADLTFLLPGADGTTTSGYTLKSNGSAALSFGTANIVTSDTAPASPLDGDLWYNSANGRLFIYYADGTTNQWVDASPDSSGVTNIRILDSIAASFNGTTATFNLTVSAAAVSPVNAQQLLIVVGGVVQMAGTHYTVSGSTITFTAGNIPTSGLTFYGVIYGDAATLNTIADGAVTTAKIQNSSVTAAKLSIDATVLPTVDNSFNLGSASFRFANIFTGDLHLKNDRGDWTIIEEEDGLTMRNNKTGKVYDIMMKERNT